MKVWPILAVFCMMAVSACNDSAGPEGTTITFRTDPVGCADQAEFEITIDGEDQGSYSFAPGSEWVFQVEAGAHSVRVVGLTPETGFTVIEREVTVSEGGDFTMVLSCGALLQTDLMRS